VSVRYAEVAGVGRCSRLVLGTMAFTPERTEQATGLLDAFVAAGGNVIDTAHNYGGEWVGRSERAIGQWLQASGRRQQIIIIDKGAHPDAHGPRVHPQAIAADLRDSLARLQTDWIDVYLLHRDDPAVPVGPIMEALNEHIAAGSIRAIGASNWSHPRIDEANAYARCHGLQGFCCSSTNLSLARAKEPRWPGCISLDADGLAWHRRTGMPLFSWSSQAGGFFTGRYAPERTDDAEMVRVYYAADNWERLRRARTLAAHRGVHPAQIALAYVLHQDFPTFAIIGPLTPAEFEISVAVDGIDLSPAEVRWLNLEDGAGNDV
jgi:aryl-alcohol dehydrogenase-like predicted oxidoreductase